MIQFKDVEYTYFDKTPFQRLALSIDSLKLEMNEYYGVVGKTGSGKSTFLKILTHLIEPSKGEIILEPRPDNIRKFFGFVFQQPEHQLFCETVQEELEFSLKNFDVDESLWGEKIQEALKMVALPSDFVTKDPMLLSGGQKRRVAIASILCYEPQVLVLDEPTAGVDGESKEILLQAFLKYHQKGHCIFLVSHDLNLINNECSKVLSFKNYSIEKVGKTFEVLSNLDVDLSPSLKLLKSFKNIDSSVNTKVSKDNFLSLRKKYAPTRT
ncbi:MAG: hypothetical protein COB02_01090 [Candidatus Cloacimonadota bacterium]|nr:MAG: hypothetical protein COB02_01090 [Candidatus Cloacimonadota bacterium]